MSPGDVVSTAQTGSGTCPVEVEGTLQGKLSWWYLFAMAVASILGPWVVMSQFWYSISGPSIALAFVVVGLICIPIGLVYGELSSMFPKTGGSFLFIKHGLGKEISYWTAWALLLSYLALMSYMMSSLATIINLAWVPDLTAEAIMIISIIFTVITFGLTWRKVDLSAGVQFFLFVFTLMAGLLYLVLFVFSPAFNPAENWADFFPFGTQGFLSGVGLMVTMYFGFELIPQFAEECDYPHRKHWKVMMFSVIVAMVIYASISLVETAVRPLSEILAMPNFVGAIEAKAIYGNWLAYPVIFASMATLMSCVIGFWLGASRVMYSMGREGVMPHLFTRTNKYHQPMIANIAILAITVFLTLYCYMAGTDWVVALYTMMAIGVAIAYTTTCVAYVRLKYTRPNHPRLWKAPGGKVMGAVAAVAGLFITYEVFATFNQPTWIVFILFFVIVIFLRLYLAYDQKAHKEKYYDVDDNIDAEQMAEIAKKEG